MVVVVLLVFVVFEAVVFFEAVPFTRAVTVFAFVSVSRKLLAALVFSVTVLLSASAEVAAVSVFDDDFADNKRACLHFEEPVWGVTPGQSLVLYKDGLVVGGGLIES